MKTYFAPGCALRAYKPHLVDRMAAWLRESGLADGVYTTCCKDDQRFDEETLLIVCCPGCAHKFEAFKHVRTVSLWKTLLETDFPLPDYAGRVMAIHDACHARHRNSSEMQESARALCARMGIRLLEPALTRDETPCCGGSAADIATRKRMACERAAQLPAKDVALYCTGCVRSFSVTEARPHHLFDLIFGEETEGLTLTPPTPAG